MDIPHSRSAPEPRHALELKQAHASTSAPTLHMRLKYHCGNCPHALNAPNLSRNQRFLRGLHLLLDAPEQSTSAMVVNIFIIAAIVVSTVSFVMETVPEYADWGGWDTIEVVVVITFTLEYTLRVLACRSVLRFHKSILNWIDILAFLPFYLELAVGFNGVGFPRVLRVIRMTRVFRIFRFDYFSRYTTVVALTLQRSRHGLITLLFFIAMAVAVTASILYYVERGDLRESDQQYIARDGYPSDFQNIPQAFWLAINTLVTTGYGDDVTLTVLGKVVVSLAALSGILILALPITITGSFFAGAYNEQMKKRLAVHELLQRMHSAEEDLRSRLDDIDTILTSTRAGRRPVQLLPFRMMGRLTLSQLTSARVCCAHLFADVVPDDSLRQSQDEQIMKHVVPRGSQGDGDGSGDTKGTTTAETAVQRTPVGVRTIDNDMAPSSSSYSPPVTAHSQPERAHSGRLNIELHRMGTVHDAPAAPATTFSKSVSGVRSVAGLGLPPVSGTNPLFHTSPRRPTHPVGARPKGLSEFRGRAHRVMSPVLDSPTIDTS